MKNIILLVQSHDDAKNLPAAGRVIGRLGCQNIWVLVSPAVTVTEANLLAATAEFDKDITALRQAEESATKVRDYKTAEDYKAKIEALVMNRSTTVRNVWKGVTEADRKKEFGRYANEFLKAANPANTPRQGWRVSLSAEHHPHTNWITLLNEHSGKATWHDGMKPGEFSVMWPGQLVELEQFIPMGIDYSKLPHPKPIINIPPKEADKLRKEFEKLSSPPVVSRVWNLDERRKELLELRHFGLVAVAKKLKIDPAKRPRAEIIEDIIAAEGKTAVVA